MASIWSVSYTHLDVYKRQRAHYGKFAQSPILQSDVADFAVFLNSVNSLNGPLQRERDAVSYTHLDGEGKFS